MEDLKALSKSSFFLMSSSLKDKNKAFLSSVLVAHAVLFWLVFASPDLESLLNVEALIFRLVKTAPFVILPALLSFLLQGVVASDLKARLVYWRFRKNPYPGSEAFTKWLHRDNRIDINVIKSRYHPLPIAPADQNALWYRIYRLHQHEPNVEDAHKRFLLARDLACCALIFGTLSSVALVWGASSYSCTLVYIIGSILYYVSCCIVAQNHGNRFVMSVLANESAR